MSDPRNKFDDIPGDPGIVDSLRTRIAELEDEVARLTHVYILGNADLRAENARLREALEKAADSLRWIANRRRTEVNETHADVLMEVWGYARSRETVARAALEVKHAE